MSGLRVRRATRSGKALLRQADSCFQTLERSLTRLGDSRAESVRSQTERRAACSSSAFRDNDRLYMNGGAAAAQRSRKIREPSATTKLMPLILVARWLRGRPQ